MILRGVDRRLCPRNNWRTAKLLVDRHEQDAPIYAAMRADELLAVGDVEGVAVWKRILRAIDVLKSRNQPEGARVH